MKISAIVKGFNGGIADEKASDTIKTLTKFGQSLQKTVRNFKDGYKDLSDVTNNTLGLITMPQSRLENTISGIKNVIDKLEPSTKATIKSLGKLSIALAGVWAAYKMVTLPETVANQRNEAAQTAANAVNDVQVQIAQYKSQIEQYNEIINDQSSSIEDVTAAREGLINVQNELISNFGSEANGIESVTAAINGQVDALDNLSIAAYNQAKADFNADKSWESYLYDFVNTYIPNTNQWISDALSGNFYSLDELPDAPTNMEAIVQQMRSAYIEIPKSGNELLDRYISKLNGIETNFDGDAFVIKGNQMEVLEMLNQISSLSNGYKNIDDFSQALSNVSAETATFVDSNKELYNQYLLYEKIFQDDQLKAFYNNLIDAKSEYDTALSEGNAADIENSLAKYAELYNQITAMSTDQLGSLDSGLEYYFENLHSGMASLVGEYNFDEAFKSNSDNIKQEIYALGKSFADISEHELKNFNWALYPDDSEIGKAFQQLTDISNKYGISIDSLVDKMIDFEAIQSDAYKSLVKQFGSDNILQLTERDLEYAYRIENIGDLTFEELRKEIDDLRAKAENTIDLDLRTNLDGWEAAAEEDAYRADYDKYTKALERGKKLYKSGMVGSKEFQAIAKMFSMSGMTDAGNWAENISYLGKYFTEGSTGLEKFVSTLSKTTDASGQFFAEWDEGAKSWKINTTDMEMMAAQLGMPLEMLTVMLEALRDYGLTKDWFGSYEDGITHLGDLYGELADKKSRLEEMKLLPDDDPRKSQSAIEQLEKEIGILEGRIKSTKNSLNDLLNSSADDYMNEYNIAKETMDYLANEYNKTLGDNSDAAKYTREAILGELGELQEKYGIEFSITADKEVAIGSLEDIHDQAEAAKQKINDLRESDGSINLDDQDVKDAYDEFVRLRKLELEAEKPVQLNVDASTLEEKPAAILSSLEDQMNSITIDKEVGIDTTKAEANLSKFLEDHKEFLLACGIDSTSYDELVQELQSETIEVPVKYTTDYSSTLNTPADAMATVTVNVQNEDDITNLERQLDEIPSEQEAHIDCTVSNKEEFDKVKDIIESRPNTTATITINPDVPDDFGSMASQWAQQALSSNPVTLTVDAQGTVTYVNGSQEGAADDSATVNYDEVGNQEEPVDMDAHVNYTLGTQEKPVAMDAAVNYKLGSQATPKNKTAYVTYVEQNSIPFPHANGTAHANGTLFSPENALWHQLAYHMGTTYGIQHGAYVGGNWGIPYDQTALVGELGQELVVTPDGKWQLVGERGTEFTNLEKGSIVFNHKQTKQLLENGYVTGRGKPIGFSALANGTVGGNAYAGVGGGTGLSFGVGGGHKYSSSSYTSTKATSSVKEATDAAEDFEETVDFVAIAIERMNAEIELHKSLADSLYQTYRNQNAELNVAISQTEELLKFQKKAYNRYMEQAKASGLSDEYQKLVMNGQLDIRTITDENLKNQINDFTEWYNLAKDLETEIVNTASSLRDLKLQKLDNIVDDFDRIVDNSQTLYDMIEALHELNELKGISTTVQDLAELMELQVDIAGYRQGEVDRLTKEFEALIASGDISKYNDDWYDWINQINEAKTASYEAEAAALELKEQIFELQFVKPLEKTIEELDRTQAEIETLNELIGDSGLFEENGTSVTFSFAGTAKLALLGEQLAIAKKRSAEYTKAITELNKNLANGNITQDKYNELLADYSEEQQQAVLDTKAAMDAIIDLRIEGLEKSYTAYEKLISIRKKDMEAQKEYQDQQEALSDKQAELNAIEAQIAMAQGDPAQTQRLKQLQAQKKELQEEYDDMVKEYRYNSEMDAYDEDLEAYREYVDEETEKLESDLNYRNQIIQESLGVASQDHEDTYDHLSMLAEIYGLTLQTNVVDKWSDASSAMEAYYEAIQKAEAKANIVSDKIEVSDVKSTDTTPSEEENAKNIAHSSPINSTAAYSESDVRKLYKELLGRDIDSTGLATWMALQEQGGTLDDVRNGILNSSEYKALQGQNNENSTSSSTSAANTSDTWKGIATQPSTKGASKYNKSISYSLWDRIAWNGYKPSWNAQKQLWSNLGGSGTFSGTSAQNTWMIEQLKKRGFRDGGIAELIEKSGEQGIAFVRNKEALVADRHVPIMQDILEAMPTIDNIFKDIKGTMGNYNLKPIDYNVTMHCDNMLNVEGSVDAAVISNLKKFANEVSNQATNQVIRTLKNQSYKPGYKGLGK